MFAEPVVHAVGKEGNKLDARASGVALGPEEYQNVYVDPDEWDRVYLPALRELGAAHVAGVLGLDRRTVQRWLAGVSRPYPRNVHQCIELVLRSMSVASDEP